MDNCIIENDFYRANLWAHNGPNVIIRALRKLCQNEDIISISSDVEKSKSACKGMQFLPFDTFYPIINSEKERFFNAQLTWSKESQLAKIASLFNTSYSCHFPAQLLRNTKLTRICESSKSSHNWPICSAQ